MTIFDINCEKMILFEFQSLNMRGSMTLVARGWYFIPSSGGMGKRGEEGVADIYPDILTDTMMLNIQPFH